MLPQVRLHAFDTTGTDDEDEEEMVYNIRMVNNDVDEHDNCSDIIDWTTSTTTDELNDETYEIPEQTLNDESLEDMDTLLTWTQSLDNLIQSTEVFLSTRPRPPLAKERQSYRPRQQRARYTGENTDERVPAKEKVGYVLGSC